MPDVVLMDVRMPGIGGVEATEIITTSLPDTHVIVLT
jgi:YesN/AraC family two-component response regulator